MTAGGIRAAIVGLGAMGAGDPLTGPASMQSHATALAAIPGVELVGAADVSKAARERFCHSWAERWPGVRMFSDHRALLEAGPVDLLTIATPDHLHGRVLLDAIHARVPRVFTEKPLVTDLEEADEIIAAAQRAGTSVQVNYTRRFRPEFQAARSELRAGAVGRLSQILVRNGGARAMLFRNTTHFVDLACFFAETDPCWVTCELDEGFDEYGLGYAGDGGTDPSLEPGCNLYVAFDGRARAFISDRKSAYREQSLVLIGQTGSITVSGGWVSVTTDDPRGGHAERRIKTRARVGAVQAGIEDLLASGSSDALISPATEARKSVSVVAAALLSHATGNGRVEVPRPIGSPSP